MDFPEYIRFLYHLFFIKKKIHTKKEESVFSINYSGLKNAKIKLLIFDVDDTLTVNRGKFEKRTLQLLKRLSNDFKIAIFSNCGRRRRREIAQMLKGINLYISPLAKKPEKKGFVSIMKRFNISADKTAMIGDRTGTDIWGAYVSGIKHRIIVLGYPVPKDTKLNYFLKSLRNIERGFK